MILPKHVTEAFASLHLDFGELAKKSEGVQKTKSFLVIVDEFTRLVQVQPMRETSQDVTEHLKHHLDNVKTTISDNGKAFTSKKFTDWAATKWIYLKTTSPYHPATNGLAE